MNKRKSIFMTTVLFATLVLTSCLAEVSDSTNPNRGDSASEGGGRNDTSETSGGGSTAKDQLYIQIYDGGYGEAWIQKIAADYEAKTNVKVNYNLSISILDRLESDLMSSPDYDIYMSHDINWQSFAANDLLEPLDDLYEREVEGTGKTFSERLVSGATTISREENSKGQKHYYRVNYTQGAGGLVYNIDMFQEYGWTVPTTYAELVALAGTITSAQIEVPGTRDTVVPFAWAGMDRQYYWDYLVFEWWAQLAGLEKVNTFKKYLGPTGKYSDGYEMFNPDTHYKEFMDAYKMWHDLIALNDAYSTPSAYGNNLFQAQADFANGRAAMIPYAQWAKFETENAIAHPLEFDIAMMKTPRATSTAPYVNYLVGFGDSMIVPRKISDKSKALAKDFLAYLATYEACATFAEQSKGAFLAFDYQDVELSAEANSDTFIASIKAKLTETTSFNLVSDNPITVWTTNKVMPWIENEYYYAVACSEKTKYTHTIVGPKVYKAAKDGWASWLRAAGLRD